MIPKRIITIWLGGEMPEHIKKCVETHKLEGYEHLMITDASVVIPSEYVKQCIQAGKWAKATDYLRMYYLAWLGGVYLDADVTVLPGKNFDDLLHNEMFVGEESNGFVSNAIVGSVAEHTILLDYLGKVNRNFLGDGDLVFQPGMFLWTEIVRYSVDVTIYPPNYFLPYDHHKGMIVMTDNTRTFHHFNKSWMNERDVLPTVSILIPTLNRPEGLKRCLDSIDRLLYPKHLIEVLVDDEAEGTVPEKIDRLYKKAVGWLLVYAADDMEFNPLSIYNAVIEAQHHGLVAFNAGPVLPDEGNICEHFLIRRDLIDRIGGQIFDTDLFHVGVDNLLWARAKKLGEAYHSDTAVIAHYHFSKPNGAPMDATYERAWKAERVEHDRALLKTKLEELNA